MKFMSVCSGIEAASVAWEPMGWEASAVAEIEPFPCHVLHHRQGASRPLFVPDEAKARAVRAIPAAGRVPNFGDMTRFREWPDADVDLLVGGTPCQSFSVAGLRAGLADPRGNLALTYLAIAERYRPRWLLWENVPGVLSSNGGRDFGALVRGMVECGYGVAWRVLDAQFVRVDGYGRAVPQRRRRVFVVGHLGDWRRAAAVLVERESLQGHPAPRRKAREGPAAGAGGGAGIESWSGRTIFGEAVAGTLIKSGDAAVGTTQDQNLIIAPAAANTLRAEGFDASEDGTGRTNLIAIGFNARQDPDAWIERSGPLDTDGSTQAVAVGGPRLVGQIIDSNQGSGGNRTWYGPDEPHTTLCRGDKPNIVALDYAPEHAATLTRGADSAGKGGPAGRPQEDDHNVVALRTGVRRLTPRECERLQGFPDDYTAVPVGNKEAADGPRYRALGNSMAVNVMRWIGRRIEMVEDVAREMSRESAP